MPIKLKKTNIQYDIEKPSEGYMILGFDESGNLVTKNSAGDYEPIISDVSTGNFVRLEVDYLTVGNRVSGVAEGIYSIGQGLNISAPGDTSYAQGNSAVASGVYTYARGEFVEASGVLSHVSGRGAAVGSKLVSSGLNSFVHQISSAGGAGVLSDRSAILGGLNNNIGTSATDSAILGGTNNTINASVLNSVILGGASQTAINSNAVYLPRLVLTNTSALSQSGSIYYDGSNFKGYDGSNYKKLDISVSTPGANRLVTSTSGGDLVGQEFLTYSGTQLSIKNTSSGDVSMLFDAASRTFSLGIDDSDNYFKLYYGTSLGSTNDLTVFENSHSSVVGYSYTKFFSKLYVERDNDNNTPLLQLRNINTGTSTYCCMSYSSEGKYYTMGTHGNSSNTPFAFYAGSTIPITTTTNLTRSRFGYVFDGYTKNINMGDYDLYNKPAKLNIFTRDVEGTQSGGGNPDGNDWVLYLNNDRNEAAGGGILMKIGEDTPTSSDSFAMRVEDGNGSYQGSIYFDNTGLQFYNNISDVRRKINITDTTLNGLDILSNLEIVDFNYRKSVDTPVTGITSLDGTTGITSYDRLYTNEYHDKIYTSYIAQDAINKYPMLVHYFEQDDHWAISFEKLVPVLHKAILEQQTKIEELETRIYNLENPV